MFTQQLLLIQATAKALFEVKYSANTINSQNMQSQTDIYKMTFDCCDLPKNIKIEWTSLEVRQCIRNPRQCYKRQKYNRSSRTCRSEEDICDRFERTRTFGRGTVRREKIC